MMRIGESLKWGTISVLVLAISFFVFSLIVMLLQGLGAGVLSCCVSGAKEFFEKESGNPFKLFVSLQAVGFLAAGLGMILGLVGALWLVGRLLLWVEPIVGWLVVKVWKE